MSTEPLSAPKLIAYAPWPENANPDKLHAFLQSDPNWIFDTSANEPCVEGERLRGTVLIYRHRVGKPPVTIAIPTPDSGPVEPAWKGGSALRRSAAHH
ncbi:hypothetical protein ABZ897_43195 [Nonomuraea sp. NPDC046802]|uniref:hypothetical protein n=1 Tax=Nonomuraea sp. NPDC046802 TaxID=3154919 RepID=UPI00340B2237